MSCPKPLVRAETYETYVNKKGGISYKEEWLQRDQYDNLVNDMKYLVPTKYRKIDLVPCGQCIECRLQYTREWATRCMLEKQYGYYGGAYPENTCWFLTLTYKDEALKGLRKVFEETGEVKEGISIWPEDMQLFWKRVRKKKKWKDLKIKYLNVSEYGHQTHRPHNHAIVFGLPLDITKFKKEGVNEWGDPYWTTDELDDCWYTDRDGLTVKPAGHITIGRVTWKSCAYVARYNLKKIIKQEDNLYYDLQGILPEHVSMSNSIGYDYMANNWDKILATDSVPVINPKSGDLAKAPKRFMRILEEVDNDMYRMIKDRRKIIALSNERGKRLLTDLTPEEMRKQSEERMKSVIHDLRKDP